ncbi:MAG: hypothetical protein KDB14_23945 [Planctomycetales bacterium]|nr:hypothetical protein [Planctomycetales bacterium]
METFDRPDEPGESVGEAACRLCSYCAQELGKSTPLPANVGPIIEKLLARGLDYKDAGTRACFISYLDALLADRPEDQLAYLRDALNDSDEGVRWQAVLKLEQWIDAFCGKELRVPWTLVTRRRLALRQQKFFDEIVDMLVSKGLTDPALSVHGAAASALFNRRVKPNRVRIRALKRVIDNDLIPTARGKQAAADLARAWSAAPPKPAPGKDPFAPAKRQVR